MQSSLMFQDLKTERYFSQDEIQDKRKVKVYIRTVSRKSIKIQLPQEIQLSQLKEIILNKLNIETQNQILYLKGVCINFNLYILLENSWIIHAINKAEVDLPQITIDIRTNVMKKKNQQQTKYTFDPKIKVRNFIKEFILKDFEINLNQVILIESGRILRQNLTFFDQNIQFETTLNLVHSVKDLGSSIKPMSLLFESKQNSKISSTITDYKSQQKSMSLNSLDEKISSKNKKITKTKFCQFHQIKGTQSVLTESPLKSSRLKRKDSQLRSSITIKNHPIQVGQRECNCNKQVKTIKQPKFITEEDKKRLSKQIRQQNLNKLLKSKIRKDGQMEQPKTKEKKKKLFRANSLIQLDCLHLNEKSKSLKFISNPQKLVTF